MLAGAAVPKKPAPPPAASSPRRTDRENKEARVNRLKEDSGRSVAEEAGSMGNRPDKWGNFSLTQSKIARRRGANTLREGVVACDSSRSAPPCLRAAGRFYSKFRWCCREAQKHPSTKLTKSAERKSELARLAKEIAGHDGPIPGRPPKSLRCGLRRAEEAQSRYRSALSRIARPDSPSLRVGAKPAEKFAKVVPPRADALARQCVPRRRRRRFRGARAPLPRLGRKTNDSSSPRNPRSTGCRPRCAMKTASSCRGRPAATASKARTSPPICAPSATCLCGSTARCPRSSKCAAKSI